MFEIFLFKVYYHLGAFEDSLMYALGAGELFNVNSHSQYVETIIGELVIASYFDKYKRRESTKSFFLRHSQVNSVSKNDQRNAIDIRI